MSEKNGEKKHIDALNDRVKIGPISSPGKYVWTVVTMLFGGVAVSGHVDPFTPEEDFGPQIRYQYNQLDTRLSQVEDRQILPEANTRLAAIDARIVSNERHSGERFETIERQLSELRALVLRRITADGQGASHTTHYWRGLIGQEPPIMLD